MSHNQMSNTFDLPDNFAAFDKRKIRTALQQQSQRFTKEEATQEKAKTIKKKKKKKKKVWDWG